MKNSQYVMFTCVISITSIRIMPVLDALHIYDMDVYCFTESVKVTILIQATQQYYINVLLTSEYLQNSTRTNSLSAIPVLKLSFVKTSTPSSSLISSQNTIVDIAISKQILNILNNIYYDQPTQRAHSDGPSNKWPSACIL
jgi:hypothetical protein